MRHQRISIQLLLLFAICIFLENVNATIKLEKAVLKVSYVDHGEKFQRIKAETTGENIATFQPHTSVQIDSTDSISLQVLFTNEKDEQAFVKQLFLRIENVNTAQDNLYLLKKRGKDMRLDLNLKKEIKSDLDFWQKDHSYKLQVVMGDLDLPDSRTWTITENMSFLDTVESKIFVKPARKVFDFDVGVKKTLLPEFSFPIPIPEKRASFPIIVTGLLFTVAPWILLFVAWSGLGAFKLSLPENKGERFMFIVFELCVFAHLIALTMFWLKWNIITTGKTVAVLMIPTLIVGRNLLPSKKD